MSHRAVLSLLTPVVAIAAVAIGGCGSGSGSSTSGGGGGYGSAPAKSSAKTTVAAPAGASATVGTASTDLGTILVDGSGRTLYLFEADKGTTSTCNGACAAAWPPLITTGDTKVSGSAKSAELGTTKRDDGSTQVTYGGHPVYTFAGDTAAGQTTGQGLDVNGGEWYVMDPAGTKVEKAGS